MFLRFYERTVNYCTAIYQDDIFLGLMRTKQKFDLIVVEGVLNECVLPLVQIHKAPLIYMVGITPPPWLLDSIGSPQAFDHFPNPAFSYTDEMSLLQRMTNAISGIFGLYFRQLVLMSKVDQLIAQFRLYEEMNMTSSSTMRQVEQEQLSLLISNTNPIINYELPKTPAIIEAGGLHCVPSKPLPKVGL